MSATSRTRPRTLSIWLREMVMPPMARRVMGTASAVTVSGSISMARVSTRRSTEMSVPDASTSVSLRVP